VYHEPSVGPKFCSFRRFVHMVHVPGSLHGCLTLESRCRSALTHPPSHLQLATPRGYFISVASVVSMTFHAHRHPLVTGRRSRRQWCEKQAKPFYMAFRTTATAFAAALALAAARPLPTVRVHWAAAKGSGLMRRTSVCEY
jgi:hypothetical protein